MNRTKSTHGEINQLILVNEVLSPDATVAIGPGTMDRVFPPLRRTSWRLEIRGRPEDQAARGHGHMWHHGGIIFSYKYGFITF